MSTSVATDKDTPTVSPSEHLDQRLSHYTSASIRLADHIKRAADLGGLRPLNTADKSLMEAELLESPPFTQVYFCRIRLVV